MSVELRPGRPGDVEAVLGLLRTVFGEDDGARVRDLFAEPVGAARWLLAWDGDDLVACSALLPHRLHLDGVELPVGQVEWVATAETHRRRGLVRAQFEGHHRAARDEGMLLTLVAGIPYLYRRFGYGYGLDSPTVVSITPDRPAPGQPGRPAEERAAAEDRADGARPAVDADDTSVFVAGTGDRLVVRRATTADRAELLAMDARRTTPVRIVRDDERWDRRLRTTDPGVEETLVAVDAPERATGRGPAAEGPDGRIRGWARLQTYPADAEQYLIWGPDHDEAATRAIVAHARRRVPEGLQLVGYGPPGTWVDVATEVGRVTPYGVGYYVRAEDPVAVLRALVPVLDRRLAAAGRWDTGPLDLSLYGSGVRLELEEGHVVGVEPAPAVEDPFVHDDVGVAPDLFPALVLGRWGAAELADRHDDVTLGRHHDLMAVLFPRLDADLADDL